FVPSSAVMERIIPADSPPPKFVKNIVRTEPKAAPSMNISSGRENFAAMMAQNSKYNTTEVLTDTPAFGGNLIDGLPPDFFLNDGLAFYTFHHPFAPIFLKKLNQGGVAAMLAADTAEFATDPAKGMIDQNPPKNANDKGNTFIQSY